MKILLACNAGASTSIVVQKMKEAAKELNEDHEIEAVDIASVRGEIGNFDVLLLGPQVAMHLKRFTEMLKGSVPVAVIKPMDYGRLRGAAILAYAKQLVEEAKNNENN